MYKEEICGEMLQIRDTPDVYLFKFASFARASDRKLALSDFGIIFNRINKPILPPPKQVFKFYTSNFVIVPEKFLKEDGIRDFTMVSKINTELHYPEILVNEMLQNQMKGYLEDNLKHRQEFTFSGRGSTDYSLPFSKYGNSRLDMYFFSNNKGAVIMYEETNEEDDDTLTDCMTENKQGANKAIPQMLAGMDKLASRMLYEHFRRYPSFISNIRIYGALLSFREQSGQIYQLDIDFKKRSSVLTTDGKTLLLSDACTRLANHFLH